MDIRLTKILASLGPATGGKKIRNLVRSGSMRLGLICPTAGIM